MYSLSCHTHEDTNVRFFEYVSTSIAPLDHDWTGEISFCMVERRVWSDPAKQKLTHELSGSSSVDSSATNTGQGDTLI